VGSSACGSSAPYYDPANYPKEYDPRAHEYVIGVGDSLKITVWRTPDLTSAETVRPDGTITLALIGDVSAADKTATEVRDLIKKKLADFIKDESAVVTVAVSAVNSYRFVVAGNVSRPGAFTSKYYVTIAEAIAMAGGPTRFADTGAVLLLRPEPHGKIRRIPVDYDKVSSFESPEQNLVIARGDTVYVP
jgi:polysaccharide export outer membrane protein